MYHDFVEVFLTNSEIVLAHFSGASSIRKWPTSLRVLPVRYLYLQ